ncbi:MAG: helix-turn-helix transcriptional regulator [Gemmatimonadales bacterium]|nr:helix-turn-helix transcriptional regulator [Gemmatimonadales bacterium]MBA3556645.1 helix-turn-helix transcriptional regulator [Gemmatimonadales bacterium]
MPKRRFLASERVTLKDLPPCGCSSPGETDPVSCYCGVEDILRVIRRRYSLAVMSAIHTRATPRYNEIAAALPQASSSTLAETLHALEAAQLLVRHDRHGGAGPHTAYALTPSGAKLLSRLRVLLDEVQPS